MSHHKAEVTWKRATPDFKYESYDRTHSIQYEGGIKIQASSAPEYAGNAKLVNPEEQLVGAISACHMLTFLAVACKSGFIIDDYVDQAVGTMEKGPDGKIWVTKVELNPTVKFSGANIPDRQKQIELHEKAHRNCFVANSVKSEVHTNVK